jgi:hypothetical protein
MKKFKIFSTSHRNVNYLDSFSPLVTMVGLGEEKFPDNWINSNFNNKISSKFFSYADLVGYYHIWKKFITDIDNDTLISFSQYRRFWLKKEISKDYPLESLKELFLTEIPDDWNGYDAIIPSKFVFKSKFKEILKNFKIKVSVKDQFNDAINQKNDDLLNNIIDYLPAEEKSDFYGFLESRNYLSAHGMFIANKKIINEYFSLIFAWYEKCEQIINPNNRLTLDKTPRFFQYLNERFLDYWFNKYYNCKIWPIAMYNDQKSLITRIGKI